MRKEVRVYIEDAGEKHEFIIRQMPASQLEWWIIRAVQCLGPALELPEGKGLDSIGEVLANRGLAALSGVDPEKAKPLLDEMLATASRVVDGRELPCNIETVDGYFESVASLFKLRVETFKANFDFFGNGGGLSSPANGKKSAASKSIRIARQ